MLNKYGQGGGLNAGLSLWLPLNDLGSGAVNTVPANSSGDGTATFTRATTATTILSTGLIGSVASGTARSCYSPAGVYLGYLAEEARTNLCLQSAVFGTTWTVGSATISSDAIASPDGTVTADKLQEDNTTNFHTVVQSITKAASSLVYSFSVYVKALERTWVAVQLASGGNGYRAWFNVGTGAVGSTAAVGTGWSSPSVSITQAGNGFYRCVFTITTDATTTIAITMFTATGDTATSFLGTTGSGVYLWGAQLEQAAFATSLIPTTTAAVTRNADVLTYPASGNVNTSVQTAYAEVAPNATATSVVLAYGTSGVDGWAMFENSTGTLRQQMFASSVNVEDIQSVSTFSVGAINKAATKYSAADSGQFLAGAKSGTTANPSGTPAAPTSMYVGAQSSGAAYLNGTIRNARIWTRALADSQLVSLTS